MKILFLGDIFGQAGRDIIKRKLGDIKSKNKLDLVIANAENCTHGKGLNWDHYHFLKEAGIDFFTMGNHTWSKKEILEILEKENNIIRPLNLNSDFQYWNIGQGSKQIEFKNKKIRITNLLGESVLLPFKINNPFLCLENILAESKDDDIHIVDFHAETTSEKNAFGIYFDGKVSAILGTHTHVPTNDIRITPKKTIYATDVGMCGPGFGSIIGAKPENVIIRFLNPETKFKLEVSDFGAQLNGVIMEFDDISNKPISYEQIRIIEDDSRYLDWEYKQI